MNITMDNKVDTLIEELKDMELNNKVKSIYKWHNGLALAKDLNEITGDNTFEFVISADSDCYQFKNKNNESVIINSSGDIDVHSIFVEISQERLLRTNNMLEAVWS